jgi:hypothetical protein
MTRLVVWCALGLVVFGCKSREEPAAPSNVVEALPPDTVEVEAQPPATDTAADPEEAVAAEPTEAVEAAAVEAAAVEPARDLAAELRAAVGSPADCVRDYRPSSATLIRINISAVVRPTGMIIEPTATGRGLSMNDRRCIEQRVGEVALSPLSGKASEPVSTYVDIPYEPPKVEEDDVGTPPPQREGVVQPLPKKKPIAPSGVPIEGPAADPIEGPSGVPIEGPKGVPIEGPKPQPIDGY